jgi:hypothetical protein
MIEAIERLTALRKRWIDAGDGFRASVADQCIRNLKAAMKPPRNRKKRDVGKVNYGGTDV